MDGYQFQKPHCHAGLQSFNRCLRYKELEDALSIAEQHLVNNEQQQQAMQQIQDQIDQIQQQLDEGSGMTQELQKQHEAARAAQQMAADELTAATQQRQTIQVIITPISYI